MKANIFDYATKELSQDAFYLWLIQWADENYVDDINLHKTAVDFVTSIFLSKINYIEPIKTVKVYKQWEKIDVSFTVNDNLYVIIEDKTNSKTNGNQLERYKKEALDWCNNNKHQLLCIYLKSENESKASLDKNVVSEGYEIVTRKEILELLSCSQTSNDIFLNYIERLKLIEEETNSYKSKPYKEWNDRAWQGFYMELENNLDKNNWDYVPNANGGFLRMSWNWLELSDCYLYLQIEQGNLCIKIGEVEDDRTTIRDKWYNVLENAKEKFGYPEIHKPSRFGNGCYMTIGVIDADDYLGTGIIDISEVNKKLKKYELLLDYMSE